MVFTHYRSSIVFAAIALLTTSCTPVQEPPVPPSPIDLTNWKLTLPISGEDEQQPQEVKWPELGTYESDYFKRVTNPDGITFRAYASGATTTGSDYARSELREMENEGKNQAKWSNREGSHTMTIRQSIDRVPESRPSLAAGQIHATTEFEAMIRLDGNVLSVKTDDETQLVVLDQYYELGSVFTVSFTAAEGQISISYNGEKKAEYIKHCKTCYFKAGVYLQTNPSHGEDDDAYGEVTVYDLAIEHDE